MTFDLSDLVTGVGALISGLVGAWVTLVKMRSDKQAAEGDRITRLEARVSELEDNVDDERKKYDEERALRLHTEEKNHRLRMALASTIDHIAVLSSWVRGGAKPPPPVEPDLDEIRALLD